MNPKTFLVTGATGFTGRHTAELLRARGHRVRALAHREDERATALRAQGMEVVVGDLLDLPAVRGALQGVDGAYFVYPVIPGIVQATAFFAQAAREAGVGAVVNMSQRPARADARSHASLNHWVAERVFDWSGLGVTHLRPTIFAEWLLYFAAQAGATGVLSLPFQNHRVALTAAEDQAHVIAAVLEAPEAHRGQTYSIFGPVEQTFPEIAADVSRALGREIRYEPAEVPAFAARARASGREEFTVQHVTEMARDFRDGVFAGTNDVVRRVGGREPMTVAQFVARHAGAFAASQEVPRKSPSPLPSEPQV